MSIPPSPIQHTLSTPLPSQNEQDQLPRSSEGKTALKHALATHPRLVDFREQPFTVTTEFQWRKTRSPVDHFAFASNEPRTIDPGMNPGTPGIIITTQLFEGLLTPSDPDHNNAIAMGMADTMAVSEDKTMYLFHIRSDAKWSDGSPVRAQDFVFSYHRVLSDPEVPGTSGLRSLRNAQAYRDGKASLQEVGVHALSSQVLALHMEHSNAELPAIMTGYADWLPVHPPSVQQHGKQWTRAENIITNGAFTLQSRDMEKLRLTANPHHRSNASAQNRKVTAYISSSESSAKDWFETGKVDWVYSISSTTSRQYLQEHNPALQIYDGACIYTLLLNVTRPPFDNSDLRRAIFGIADRKTLAHHVYGQGARSATGLIPPRFRDQGYRSPVPQNAFPTYDDVTKQLRELGYSKDNPLTLELIYNTSEANRDVAEVLQRQAKERSGGLVSIDIHNLEWKALVERATARDYTMARMGFCPDYHSPLTFLKIHETGHSENLTGFSNQAYDNAVYKARRATTLEERNAHVAVAESVLNEQLPRMPLFFFNPGQLMRPGLTGFAMNRKQRPLAKNLESHSWFGRTMKALKKDLLVETAL